MSYSTPVVGTLVGDILGIVRDGESRSIMEHNFLECTAKNINRALNHPNSKQITTDAGELVEKEHTHEAAIERF